jgi:hypothetical protein
MGLPAEKRRRAALRPEHTRKSALGPPHARWTNERFVSASPRFQRASTLAAAAATLALVVSPLGAAAGIDDLGGTKPGDLPSGGKFLDADGCAQCHGGGFAGDTSYLPFDTWAGTMMANAARDPVFFAALAVANQDAPGIGTFCVRCHAPIGFVRGHATPPDGSALDKVDRQGIGCETCHRATQSPPPFDPYLLGDAQLVFTEDTSKHGPYDSEPAPAHISVLDPGLGDSRFCGQCHQVTNPERILRDAAGVETGVAFPLDTTYEEWASSAYAIPGSTHRGCVDCHMPRTSGDLPIATVNGAPLRKDPRRHALTGGNHWGIQAVMSANPDRAAAFPKAFENALESTLETLKQAVAITIVSAPAEISPGATFEVTVRVENLTGHKFPAGYAESRRAWVAVALTDQNGSERALAGAYDAATGHLEDAPKTRIYRAQHGRWSGQAGEAEEHIAMHDMVLSDTRIPPKGFMPSMTTMPAGDIDYKDGAGGYVSYDEATLTLTAPGDAKGAQTLSARVYFQSMTREYVEFLRDANTTTSHGQALYAIYQATGEAPPILIASADAEVSFGGEGGAGGSGSSASSSAGGGNGSAGAGGSAGEPVDNGGCGCREASATASGAPASGNTAGRASATAIGALLAALAIAIRRRRPTGP